MDINNLEKQQNTLQAEIDDLEKKVSDPVVLKNPEKIREFSQKLSSRREVLDLVTKIIDTSKQVDATQKMVSSEKDAEMLELANNELEDLKNKLQQFEKQLSDLKSGKKKKQNIKDCILEIRAGTGGEEASLFASDLFRMYARYAEKNGWKVSILSKSDSDTGGFKEIIAQISGDNCFTKLQFENGVHRVQRIPSTESSGRIHTSAASVVIYPLIEEKEISIDPSEIRIDVYRAGGPGGQSVNRTDSAVRITHIPTGTIVACQDEKSQHKNKKKAMSILASKLADMKAQETQEEVAAIRKSAIKTGDRSAKIRTYNFPQNRVTDHRIKKSWHNLKAILGGDIDQVVEELAKKE